MIHSLSLSQPRHNLATVLAIPITEIRNAAFFSSILNSFALSTVKTYGALKPILVRKLLAYDWSIV